MPFDIRAIFSRSLGGRTERVGRAAIPPAIDEETDEEPPESPITAAGSAAANPDTDDMGQGGATAATALIPEGVEALPDAAVDRTSARADDEIEYEQALPVAELAIAAALIGGDMDVTLRADLIESLVEVPGLETLDEAGVREIQAGILDAAGGTDPHSLVLYMEERLDEMRDEVTDPTLRRAAYQLAVYFCAIDGPLNSDEMDLLAATEDAFEISTSEGRALREATLLEALPSFTER